MNQPSDMQPAESEAVAGQSPAESADGEFTVVGIGASAGGLEALKEFFGAMPTDSGMAFVVVQHLEPSHESRMAEILAKGTTMNVVQAEDGMPVEPNTVYTNPPGRSLSIADGRLALGGERGHVVAAIDHFLISLAEAQGPTAVCIILSGSSGADGPRGVQAVRAAGGMCMAQEPGSAQFPAMPQGVIDTGLADYVLPPGQMPGSLLDFVQHPQLREPSRTESQGEADTSALDTILKLILTRTNSDYSRYKRATVSRRIQHRMGIRQLAHLDEYLRLLQKDDDELTQLAKDMLIGVSSFFRDSGVFDSLRAEVIMPLVQARRDRAPLRAWVAGCSSGEEAYSVAMLLLAATDAAGNNYPVQVFATDMDERALETARAGVYPLAISGGVPAPLLETFFHKRAESYQVNKQLREAVVFSRHNLLADPPFSRLDLISCRNVLIYLESAAQKKVLSVFSFALNVGGCLLLGKSEGVAGLEELFEPISQQNRIYQLVRSNRLVAGSFPLYATGRPAGAFAPGRADSGAFSLPHANLEAILQHFHASLVLTDPEGKILYFHGQTEKYLGHSKGLASLNILDMTGGMLSAKLRRAINRALQQDEPVHLQLIPLPQATSTLANLTVMRVNDRASGGLLAIIFEDTQPTRHATDSAQSEATEDEPLVAQLEAEVKALQSELRSTADDHDAASAELKAANEEVMSMNEELQSANEELEASKEELQSVNEELTTINSQLNESMAALTETNNDLTNLLGATEIATIFLDGQSRVRRFTSRATALLNLIESDSGRPISHITHNFTGLDLAADAGQVLKSLSPTEKEVQSRDGQWYTLRILPYRTLDDRIDGTVVTFSDVSRLKQTENQLRYEKTYAESIVETVRHPLLVLDHQLRVLSANLAFYETFDVEPGQTAGKPVYELGNRQWDLPQLRTLLEEIIPRESTFRDYRVEHNFEQVGRKVLLVSGRRMPLAEGIPERLLLTIEDVTSREEDREELRALNADLEQRVTHRTALAEHRSDQLRQLAAELTRSEQRERERLARLLHDNLQQLLVASRFQLTAMRPRVQDERLQKTIGLVVDLLDQSLDTSRSLTVELSPTILYEGGLDAALPWLARQMESRHGLKVESEINASVEQDDEGSALLLFSAVRELLLNVAKHAAVDSARVQLDRLDGDLVRIVVSDQGKGFDPADHRPGKDAATGLGLFSLQQRLEHIGGQCVIDTAPGRGTCVTLTAKVGRPRKSSASAKAATDSTASEAAQARTRYRSDDRIRVLLVDDHATLRQGLGVILNAEPDIALIAEANDGQEAVQQARLHRPDVIIMDVSMPGMNGIDATKAIMAELPDTKIIGLSMYIEADRADAMHQAGAVDYVSKGGPAEDLLTAIRSAAEGSSGRIR